MCTPASRNYGFHFCPTAPGVRPSRGPAAAQQRHFSGPQPFQKLSARDRFKTIAITKIAAHYALDLGHVVLGNAAQCAKHIENQVVGEPVAHKLAIPAFNTGARQELKMLRGVGDR